MKIYNRIKLNFGRLIPIVVIFCLFMGFGELASNSPLYSNSSRFHQWISADSQHFPSAKHVFAWAEAQASKGKINVLVGGSSVMFGNGQKEQDTISKKLEGYLGPKYTVINLALNGGGSFGQATYIEAWLRSLGYRTILVTDFLPINEPPYTNYPTYSYFFWDSYYANLIVKNPALSEVIDNRSFNEMRYLMWINSKLHFLDLFNYISFNYFKINHSAIFGDGTFKKLKNYSDTGFTPEFENRYPFDKEDLKITKSLAESGQQIEGLKTSISFYKKYFSSHKSNILLNYCQNSPRYLRQLSPELQLSFSTNLSKQFAEYSLNGFEVVEGCSGLGEYDYIDRVHLSDTGAKKLAYALSERIHSDL